MDMSDRGCLDVERFDLEPDRPLMHGWIEHLDLDAAARPMSAEEKMPLHAADHRSGHFESTDESIRDRARAFVEHLAAIGHQRGARWSISG
jgi:hypothetical protein